MKIKNENKNLLIINLYVDLLNFLVNLAQLVKNYFNYLPIFLPNHFQFSNFFPYFHLQFFAVIFPLIKFEYLYHHFSPIF